MITCGGTRSLVLLRPDSLTYSFLELGQRKNDRSKLLKKE